MDKPLIVAVNGPAAGAGLGLALLGDIVLASSTATFTTAYTGIGLSPDGGVSWLLPRLIGLRAAQRMMILNQSVAADEALKIGLVTRVLPAEDLAAEVAWLARELGGGTERAIGGIRAPLLSSLAETLETHLEREARMIAALSASPQSKRSEEHTPELQSLMRSSYAGLCC